MNQETIYIKPNIDARTPEDAERYEQKLIEALARQADLFASVDLMETGRYPALLLRQAS